MDTTDISKQVRSQILRASEVYENGRKDLLNILEAYEQENLEPSQTLTLAINSIRIDFKTLFSMINGVVKMLDEMDTMKIKPEVREKIRMVCGLYENGRHDLLDLLRVHDLGKRGPEITLELALESIDDDMESLRRLRDALKGEQAMGHLKKEWGLK